MRNKTSLKPRDDREKKRAFFRPKTVKNHIPQFNFRHNTCICQKKAVSLHAVCVQKETTQQQLNYKTKIL